MVFEDLVKGVLVINNDPTSYVDKEVCHNDLNVNSDDLLGPVDGRPVFYLSIGQEFTEKENRRFYKIEDLSRRVFFEFYFSEKFCV